MENYLVLSVADVERRFRPLGDGERLVAEYLCEDAVNIINGELEGAGMSFADMTDAKKGVCLSVACDMVRYALDYGKGADVFGSNEDYSLMPSDNVARGVTITDRQRRMLGTLGTHAGFVGAR